MPRKIYDKLVRDRIPEIIEAEGRACGTETMSQEAYEQALLQKLIEEATEVATVSADERTAELADLMEVVDALMATLAISPDAVRVMQQEKRAARGGFEKRIKLLWTE